MLKKLQLSKSGYYEYLKENHVNKKSEKLESQKESRRSIRVQKKYMELLK